MQERRDWNMETHNMAITALTKIEGHEAECSRRYQEARETMQTVQSKVSNLEIKIASIVGGIVALREIIAEGLQLLHR